MTTPQPVIFSTNRKSISYYYDSNPINVPPVPTLNIPSPAIPYPTNIPESYSNYIKYDYDLLNKEYDSTNNNSQESNTNLTSAINKFTTYDNDTIQNLIIQYAKPIINNSSSKSSVDPGDTSTILSSLITTYLQTRRDYLRTIKGTLDILKSNFNNDKKYYDDVIKWNDYVKPIKEYTNKRTAYENSLIQAEWFPMASAYLPGTRIDRCDTKNFRCPNGGRVISLTNDIYSDDCSQGLFKCTTSTTPPEPIEPNIERPPKPSEPIITPNPLTTTQTAFETARTNMFNQLIIYIQVVASNPIIPVADSQTTLETNLATNLNDIVNNEILIAKFPTTSTTNTTPAYDAAVLTYISNHKIYIKKLIGNITVSQPTQQPSQPASQPASQYASQYASQPVSQPASQPASQPKSQPASQYASQPKSQPEEDVSSPSETKSNNNMYIIIAIIISIIVISAIVYFMMNKSSSAIASTIKPIMKKKGGYYFFI